MGKNGQKSISIAKKVDFPYNNFPEKHISLRTYTHKTIAPSEKTTPATQRLGFRLDTAATPPPLSGAHGFPDSGNLGVCPYTYSWLHVFMYFRGVNFALDTLVLDRLCRALRPRRILALPCATTCPPQAQQSAKNRTKMGNNHPKMGNNRRNG